MFSMTVEYALRAAVFLAETPGLQTAQRIAAATKVPERYLAKVLQILAEKGLLSSQRGPSGGFELGRPPAKITLLDVVSVVEPIQRIRACPIDLPEHREQLCPLHQTLDDLAAFAEERLGTTTLADLVQQAIVPLGISAGRKPD